MAELFQTTPQNITLHLKNIFEEGELEEKATCKDFLIVQNEGEQLPEPTIRKFRIVQKEGKREVSRSVDFYNLNMIISVGYRVKFHIATRFRQWATQRLREYIVKGFVLDGESANAFQPRITVSI